MADCESLIELEHVHVARGSAVVLHDVSLRIARGEHVAILGPNGCGKSTLLKTMTCELYPIVKPDTRVRLLGRERWDLTELKRRMGVVSPELPGKPTLHTTGLDAIVTGFFSSSTLWPNLNVTDAMRERAEEILTLVGAEALREKPVGQMSAGQQRRVMIGRALAGASVDGEVQMLLLDEPSNALDLAAQHDLREMLRGLAQRGVTIVMITHHIADILPEMQRVVMMREGRIVSDGAKHELLTERRLSELFGRKITLTERDGFWNAW
ncbi:MAG TPA: ATP-binding cassette domain-containing protein [Acidobacteriaceae bacterium]|nr:ATP-binding cassette domain-containing protein [Acidobacteriaceae bacterium]